MKQPTRMELVYVLKDNNNLSPYSDDNESISSPKKRFSQNIAKKNEVVRMDQSLKSLINIPGVNSLFDSTSKALPSSVEASLDQILPNFVSKQVRRICHQKCSTMEFSDNGQPVLLPKMEQSFTESFAAVVMVDVSGYSKLTAVLAERGPQGAELLTKTMKAYLDKVFFMHSKSAYIYFLKDYQDNCCIWW